MSTTDTTTPNILMIVVDQYRYPRFSYGENGGFRDPLNQILGFQAAEDGDLLENRYAPYFPGMLKLRKNAVALHNHVIGSSACTPSRAVMFTGQYGTRTGVTQTDGMFKDGEASLFPWLKANGSPTIGHWMRAAGYSTHYFGKWHVSNPRGHSLQRFGFADWELSYPEPHGPAINNLGLYRDPGFADNACLFLRRRGLALPYNYGVSEDTAQGNDENTPATDAALRPWFTVVSFTNPHDIATYPSVISQAMPPTSDQDQTKTSQPVFGPLDVPDWRQMSKPPTNGTTQLPLNPLGFPQDCAGSIPNWNENLSTKPSCQFDASYKIGLALSAKAGYGAVAALGGSGADTPIRDDKWTAAVNLALKFTIPFQITQHPQDYTTQYVQFYAWLHSQVDPHINRVLETLEETGQADNTIVIFVADHGELGGAHGMMLEKWHVAYEEAVHVPMVVRFPESIAGNGSLQHIYDVTSHADLLPTVLGLAGVSGGKLDEVAAELAPHHQMANLPGVDLTPVLKNPGATVTYPDQTPREGVLFITDDEVTEPAKGGIITQPDYHDAFEVYKQTVEAVREGSSERPAVEGLTSGPVRQPNHIRCVRTRTAKLARYFDPNGRQPQEWEMYDLATDPNEMTNLVQLTVTPPTVRADLPAGTDLEAVQALADHLFVLLNDLETRALSIPEEEAATA